MTHLLSNINELISQIQDKYIFLFLDYDGTLAPIAGAPERAVMPQQMRNALKELLVKPGVKIAVVTGRSLRDIKTMVSLKNVIYVGNHGLEIRGTDSSFMVLIPRHIKMFLKGLKELFKEELKEIKGLIIEDKEFAIAIHYRNVDEKEILYVRNIIEKRIGQNLIRNRLRLEEGKKVFEIRPVVDWNKGDAVSWLLAKYSIEFFDRSFKTRHIIRRISSFARITIQQNVKKSIIPIYLGDDITDENGFKAVSDKGISVYIGEHGKSNAKYYLNNTDEVLLFLKEIIKYLNHE
jgi:trehalose 6-phosphate phosphatase